MDTTRDQESSEAKRRKREAGVIAAAAPVSSRRAANGASARTSRLVSGVRVASKNGSGTATRVRTASVADRAARPRRRRPRSPAGRCLAVGLVCFGLWLMLDANQLFLSAQASPLGARRTVAMDLLRPFAAISNALSLSSLVNGANDALGRGNGPGGDGGIGPNFNPPVQPPSNAGLILPGPVPHEVWRGRHLRIQVHPRQTGPRLPPIAQPTASHPLVMLDIGDSLGADFGFGLSDQFGTNPHLKLYLESQVNTGLDNPGYYNWAAHLEQFLAQYHPKVVVAMFGGNDNHNFIQFNQGVVFGTPLWRTDYGERVAQIMNEVTASGARLFWVGMPIMADPGFSAQMTEVNSVYASEAASHPGVTWFSSWKLFSTSAGQYSAYLNNPQGQLIQARYADGVHIAPGGYDMLAAAVVKPMQRAWHIDLGG